MQNQWKDLEMFQESTDNIPGFRPNFFGFVSNLCFHFGFTK